MTPQEARFFERARCELYTFQERGLDEISSADLVAALAEIETSPWVEWSQGKPLAAPKLARLLSKYRIAPENIRFGEKVLRGYEKRAFADAWGRYLSPLDNAQVPENSLSNCYSATTRINTSQNSDFAAGAEFRLYGEKVRIWYPNEERREELASQVNLLRDHRADR